jgi:hypothetical protein
MQKLLRSKVTPNPTRGFVEDTFAGYIMLGFVMSNKPSSLSMSPWMMGILGIGSVQGCQGHQ